jgi:outer membrane lipoprotein-sorting protein
MNSADIALLSRLRWALLSTLWGLSVCSTSLAADWALPDLMHLLAQQKSGKATFVEKKYISMLDKPLESSGELSFEAPDRLEKRTLKPKPEAMALDGDKLSVTIGDKRPLNVRLQDHPEVAAMVESIRGTLSGDQAALEKNYRIDFSGQPAQWQLTLTPLQSSVAKVVRQIHISGADANIRRLTFEQADGDRYEMTISKVVAP